MDEKPEKILSEIVSNALKTNKNFVPAPELPLAKGWNIDLLLRCPSWTCGTAMYLNRDDTDPFERHVSCPNFNCPHSDYEYRVAITPYGAQVVGVRKRGQADGE